MTERFFAIGRILALAVFAIDAVCGYQQPWQLPPTPLPSSPELPFHLSHSEGVQLFPLSTAESHQQPFPLPPRAAKKPKPAASRFNATAKTSSLRWTLSNTKGSIHIDVLFPSLAHLDLLRAGIIAEPAIGLNEGLYRWIIDEPTWTYTADLTPILEKLSDESSPQTHEHWLYFEGLDTIADIYIAGELVNSTANAHRWYAFPIPSHLISADAGDTNVTLVFHNVNDYAAKQAERFDPGYPTQVESPKRSRATDYEYPNRIYVRKQQSDLGWDWGPALAPVGPHKAAWLIALPAPSSEGKDFQAGEAGGAPQDPKEADTASVGGGVVVISSGIDIYRKGQVNNLPPPDPDANWIVNVTLTLLSSHDIQNPSLRLAIPSLDLYTFDTYLSSHLSSGLNAPVHAVFEIPSGGKHSPSLWWPRNHGPQHLYQAILRSDELGLEINRTVGFRTAYFDLSPITPRHIKEEGVQPGSHFRLILNQKEIYILGTNIIPLDTLSPRISPGYLRWLVESAVQSGVNMIRVWGGGSYPSQEFMEMCDEMGVMVWMDAMYAASLYPYHRGFLQGAGKEVEQVMQGVVSHPSLVVVVGNNEGELYFLGGYGRRKRDEEWKRGYEALFDGVIRDAVRGSSRGVSYIPCSTTTGYVSLDPYKGRYDNYDREKELHGTGEHYGYDASKAFDIDWYPRSRFMVEFGMFSLPSIATLDRILPQPSSSYQDEGDLYSVNSTVLRAHLKHPPAGNLSYPFPATQGQYELLSAINTYFLSPSPSLSPRSRLSRYSYSSQLYQSLYITNQISIYRRGASQSQRNRGLIVWQLNDVWEGTSWSSIEYTGRWKMVHYALAKVQREMAGVVVHNVSADWLEVGLVYTNVLRSGEEVETGLEWFDFYGHRIGQKEVVKFTVLSGKIGYQVVQTYQHLSRSVCSNKKKGCWLRITLTSPSPLPPVTTYWSPPQHLTPTLTHLATTEKLLPNLTLSLPPSAREKEKKWQVKITNTGSVTAPYVWLEHSPNHIGYFSRDGVPENGVFLNPGEEVALDFVRAKSTAVEGEKMAEEDEEDKWFRGLTVSSLFDNFADLPAQS